MSADPTRHLVLIGPMGSGKTTLGRVLADELGRAFFDSDEQIGARTGVTGREIAATKGVAELHRLEREVLVAALEESPPGVLAAAASVIEDPELRARLEPMFCVLVTAEASVLSERVAGGDHRRGVGDDELLERRNSLFRGVADLVIDTGVVSVEEGVDLVLSALAGP